MSRSRLLTVLLALVGFMFVGAARAEPGLLIGAAEDAGKSLSPQVSKAKMDLARAAGFNAVRLTTIWSPGQTAPSGPELTMLSNAANAAQADGIRVILSVYQWGSSTTPVTPQARWQFASFCAALARALPSVRDFIIGNEPNLNRFWLPQFTANGGDAAARDYEALLAQTYDALKSVSGSITVIGGSVSPRGEDDPHSSRQTHSPTAFIADLGRAYRSSGRTLPIMDEFAFHPYEDNSSLPPTFAHPNSTTIAIADYDKLRSLLGGAFDGTAQRGSSLPILYDEFGVESRAPPGHGYSGSEPPTTHAVDEATQGAYYANAFAMACKQPTVAGILIFHVSDEAGLDRWQSGVYYADDAPKTSLPIVQQGIQAVRTGAC